MTLPELEERLRFLLRAVLAAMEQGAGEASLGKLQEQVNAFGHRVKDVVIAANPAQQPRWGGLHVADWMTAQPVTVERGGSLRLAAELMEREEIRHLPVMEGQRLVGILSDRDARLAWGSKATTLRPHEVSSLPEQITVGEIMTQPPISVSPLMRIEAAANVLIQERIGALPVVEESALVGILSYQDILEAFLGVLQD